MRFIYPRTGKLPNAPRKHAKATNPDIVVVGAGAAGIAAAHHLHASGISYVHIEAASRPGGRAYTETDTFGVPFDRGAHWLQHGMRNPYVKFAKDRSYKIYDAPQNYLVLTNRGIASKGEETQLWKACEKAAGSIRVAGCAGHDIAPSAVVPTAEPWSHTANFMIGPWDMGKDMHRFSCVDWSHSADTSDAYVAEGLGTLVTEHAAALPIHLNTSATQIRWRGPGVNVETTKGTIHAKAVIITVSTGVLANQAIAFDPPLPVRKQEAFHAISMGDYNHIAVMFDRDVFGLGADGYVLHQVTNDQTAFGGLTNAHGSGLAYFDVGGSFAAELEKAGQAAAIDFVLNTLQQSLGSGIHRHVKRGAATAWRSDPLVRGCYASAEPGKQNMRTALREPVVGRIFFAGEACHPDMWATVGGAALSGLETAQHVVKTLN